MCGIVIWTRRLSAHCRIDLQPQVGRRKGLSVFLPRRGFPSRWRPCLSPNLRFCDYLVWGLPPRWLRALPGTREAQPPSL